MKNKPSIYLSLLVVFFCLGQVSAQKVGTKAKVKPKTTKSSSKDAGKRFKPDPNYEKYLNSNRIGIRPSAITVNLLSPLWGFATVGYQRKLHRHVMAEGGLGIGVLQPNMTIGYAQLAIDDQNITSFGTATYADVKAVHSKLELYGMLSYCFTGPLVNYNYGFGLFYRLQTFGVDWLGNENKSGSLNISSIGLAFHSQTMISGRIGWGYSLGASYDMIGVKNALYYETLVSSSVNKDVKTSTIGILAQLKLNVML